LGVGHWASGIFYSLSCANITGQIHSIAKHRALVVDSFLTPYAQSLMPELVTGCYYRGGFLSMDFSDFP